MGCHGRAASYLTAPAQIPACGTTALGSLEILASVADLTPYKPSVILSLHREAIIHFRKYGLPYGLSVSLCTLHLMITHFDAKLGMERTLGSGLEMTHFFNNMKDNRYCVKSQPANPPLDTVFYCKYFKKLDRNIFFLILIHGMSD